MPPGADCPPARGPRLRLIVRRWSFAGFVQIRYRHSPQSATITPFGNSAEVVFETAERAIAPGQAAVFYQEEVVLGGGWIG